MIRKECLICGADFVDNTRPKNKATCSRGCAYEAKKARERYRYRENNPTPIFIGREASMRAAIHRRKAIEKALPSNLTSACLIDIFKKFNNRCAISGDKRDVHIDHVIPISVGHGGTVRGNMIPLRADLNISKSNRNIFDWFADNRERFGLEQRKFDELIEYLADINDMTTKEYEEYVRWCHDNPRTIDEIKADNESEQKDEGATA